MSAILANAVRARNERYINRLGEDVGKYLSFLSVMSRFHKYPADDLASFAMEAPATFSAVASAETWEKHFGRSIDTRAKGVTLVRDNDRTHYYDVSETVPITLGAPEVTLWHYDDTAHRPFLDAVVPGDADTEAKVAAIVAEEMKEVSAKSSDRRLITLSTTAVVLERMGLPTADTIRQIARLSLDGRNMHNITEQTQKASQEILDAMQRSVMRGRADEADLSLPENNPLLSVFGVVTADLPEREEEAEETASQGSLFVCAVRLPNTALNEAGTEVTSDILFFRKRETPRAADEELPSWVTSTGYPEEPELPVNPYFLEHPEQVLGSLAVESRAYGHELVCHPNPEKPFLEELSSVMGSLPQVYVPAAEELPLPKQVMAENADVPPLSFFIENGSVKFYDGTSVNDVKVNAQDCQRMMSAMRIRDAVRQVIYVQVADGTDEQLAEAQATLNSAYDDYVRTYGHIVEDAALKKVFAKDAAYPLLRSLEDYGKEGYKGKSAIFTKRTIAAHHPPEHADTPDDALVISMQEKGKVELPYMASLTGATEQEILQALEFNRIFYDHQHHEYQIAEEYLSGDIRGKIEALEHRRFSLNASIDNRIAEKVLNVPDIADYTPANEMEEHILAANPLK